MPAVCPAIGSCYYLAGLLLPWVISMLRLVTAGQSPTDLSGPLLQGRNTEGPPWGCVDPFYSRLPLASATTVTCGFRPAVRFHGTGAARGM